MRAPDGRPDHRRQGGPAWPCRGPRGAASYRRRRDHSRPRRRRPSREQPRCPRPAGPSSGPARSRRGRGRRPGRRRPAPPAQGAAPRVGRGEHRVRPAWRPGVRRARGRGCPGRPARRGRRRPGRAGRTGLGGPRRHGGDVVPGAGPVLARLHVLAAANLVEAASLRRPAPHAGPRLSGLLSLVTGATAAPAVVVAALVHGEIAALRPFGTADGVVARAAGRLTGITRGLDPKAVSVPEVGFAELGREAYASALAGYATGGARRRRGLAGALLPGDRARRGRGPGDLREPAARLSRLRSVRVQGDADDRHERDRAEPDGRRGEPPGR